MGTVKRKKTEKGYSYHEYAQKFRPKSLPKEEEHPKRPPFACLSRVIADDLTHEDIRNTSDSKDHK